MSPAVNGSADQPVVIVTGGGNGVSYAPPSGVGSDHRQLDVGVPETCCYHRGASLLVTVIRGVP